MPSPDPRPTPPRPAARRPAPRRRRLRWMTLTAAVAALAALTPFLVTPAAARSATTPAAPSSPTSPLASLLSGLSGLLGSVQKALTVPTPSYTFDDEFTGAAGARPSALWDFQTGGSGWGNDELEQYTNRTANAHLDGSGHLSIVARRETYTGADGITRNYTSARLFTKTPVTFGYAEARILLPSGQGLWPAFWALGSNINQVGWPTCGEIDVVEGVNRMSTAYGTIHGPDYTKKSAFQYGGSTSPAGGLAGTWHTFAVSKTSTAISWYLDGVRYASVNRSSLTSGQQWAYDQPQYLLLNLAVGGTWPGNPDSTTAAAAGGSTMLVDWVRTGNGLPPDAQ
jgi:beta-glucanase (GH16 family)